MAKIGRNEPCPCGSGKKYKRCHGALPGSEPFRESREDVIARMISRRQAEEAQRRAQQGLGRPIISFEDQDHGLRIVAVGKTVYWAPHLRTFHDFLMFFMPRALGQAWGAEEQKKPFEQQHPILQWCAGLEELRASVTEKTGEVFSSPTNGAAAAYLGLAYNLYLLQHNIELQERLISRLKIPDQFHGAYYETSVAGAFIRAGFNIEFENEADGSSTHVEFTATHRQSKRKYSVEAKARHVAGLLGSREGSNEGRIGRRTARQLARALSKKANHARVVFIDVNLPGDGRDCTDRSSWSREVVSAMRRLEGSLKVDGEPAPPAYVFVTNLPYHHDPRASNVRPAILAEGFKIADFKMDRQLANLREAVDAREKHRDMLNLMQAFVAAHPPSTFDGEAPQFAFNEVDKPRLRIGDKYWVPTRDGADALGELEEAIVIENEKKAYGIYRLEIGHRIIVGHELSDQELAAYRLHPDTFFGVIREPTQQVSNELEFFDAIFDVYKDTPKERLLEIIRSLVTAEELKTLSEMPQREIAIRLSEGYTRTAFAQRRGAQKVAKDGAVVR